MPSREFLATIRQNLLLVCTAYLGNKSARSYIGESKKYLTNFDDRIRDIIRLQRNEVRDDDDPIFVFAAGWRCGSTLLQRMLVSSEKIMIWGEPFNRSSIVQTMSSQLYGFTPDYPNQIYESSNFRGDISADWIANIYPNVDFFLEAHRNFFRSLFKTPAQQRGRSRWGFKEVRLNSRHAKYLKLLFPHAQFIFLYRDPVEAYASFRDYLKHDHIIWPHAPVFSAASFGQMWKEQVQNFITHHNDVDGLLISYEDLVGNLETHEKVCAYVGEMLEPPKNLKVISGRDSFKDIPGGRYVPRLERMILLHECGTVRKKLGY